MKKTGYFKSPLGWIKYLYENHELYQLSIEEDLNEIKDLNEKDDFIENQLFKYFLGALKTFEIPIVFENGTDFQKQVWQELLKVPYGHTKSYEEISQAIGRPKAFRAVGQACKKNPIGIVVPCHRIIGKDHSLTGYSGKDYMHLKKELLALEKAFLL